MSYWSKKLRIYN